MGIPNTTHQVASNACAALGNWISLHTSAAGTTGANEASGTSYARVQSSPWTPDGLGNNTGPQVQVFCPAGSFAEAGIFSTSSGYYLSIPSGLAATGSATGGTLSAGTKYYVVCAVNFAGETTASLEASVAVSGSTSSVSLSCSAVSGAASYNWYRGTASGAENVRMATTTSPSYTDVGAAGTSVSPPVSNTAATFVGSNAFVGGTVTVSGTGASINVAPTWTC